MKQINKRKLLIFIILIILMAIFMILILNGKNRQNSMKKAPSVQNGVLNIEDWDFENHNRINLSGKWEFYWNSLVSKNDFENNAVKSDGLIEVPLSWNYFKIQDKKLPGFGYATYRLKVITSDSDLKSEKLLSLRINPMSTSYKLYVDGKLLESNGQVGTTKESTKPEYQPKIVVFKPPAKEFDIIVQVSNYTYARGGMWYDISLGTPKQINDYNTLLVYKDAFLIGSLSIMMLFYMCVYFMYRNDKSSLYFGLLCLLHIVRVSLYGDYFIMRIFPSIKFENLIYITYFTVYWMPVGMYLMVRKIFPKQSSRKIALVFVYYAIIMSVITMFLPIYIYTKLIYFMEGMMAIFMLSSMFAILKAYINKEKGSSIIFIGGLIILITGIHDILYQNFTISNSFGEMSSVGMFIFMFLLSALLANRFAKAFKEMEEISGALTESLKKAKDSEIAFLQAQVKPHFLFNALNSIAALCRKNPKEAEELTLDFASYLRSSFDFKNLETLTTINKELDHVRHYLNIEKVRFGKRLEVEYDINEDYNMLILPLILQPLVENAVKHGISSISRGGKVKISIKKIDKGMLFSVSDNGKGMSVTKTQEILSGKTSSGGIGVLNINNRLKNIYDISLEIISSENEGTTVSFTLPDSNEINI